MISVACIAFAFCPLLAFATLCPQGQYWEAKRQRCKPCSMCRPPDLIIHRQCEIYSDTICSPLSRILEVLAASKDEQLQWRRHRWNSIEASSSVVVDRTKTQNMTGRSQAEVVTADAQLSQNFTVIYVIIFTAFILSMLVVICTLQYKQRKECAVLLENEGGVSLLGSSSHLATYNRMNLTDQFHTLLQVDCTPAMDKILQERRRATRNHLPQLSTCENVYIDPSDLMRQKSTNPPHRA